MTPASVAVAPVAGAAAEDVYIFPPSPAQERLWLAVDADPTGSAYNVPHALAIEGAVDVEALSAAVGAVVDRHEALRTTFTRGAGGLVQVVRPHRHVPLDVTDLGDSASDAEIRSAVTIESERRFDLAQGPLIRVRVVRAGARTILCLTLHHLICDGWSLDILSRELSGAYAAAAAGLPPTLGAPPLQYADFVVWQKDGLDAEQARVEQFWIRELADLPPMLSWPADFVRPMAPTGRGGRAVVTLSEATTRAVQQLAREEATTPFVVLLSVFASFLGRWTGDRDVPIGTPVSGRDRAELENVVGLFANTVVPRFRLAAGASVRSIVADGRELMLRAVQHQAMPIERVAASLGAARLPGVTPLFQVMFAQQTAGGRSLVASVPCAPLRLTPTTAKFDVTLLAFDGRGVIDLALDFNRDLFADATMHAAVQALATMVDAGARAPDTPFEQLSWMTPPEQMRAVAAGRGAELACPMGVPVHERFASVARLRAQAVAIEEDLRTVSYGELDARAEAIAVRLQAAGIRAGDRVALLMGRGSDCVASMIGVLKAGAVYVPIDPSYPEERIAFMLDDCGARVLIASGTEAAAGDRPFIDVSTIGASDRDAPVAPGGIDGRAPAYVLYTSGSTGTPKGVIVPHRAISRLVIGADYLQIEEADRIAHAASVSFDAATFEVWGALLNGASLVIVPPGTTASPPAIHRWVRERHPTVMLLTTSVFNRVAAEAPDAFAPLRALLFGGEASDPRIVGAVAAHPRSGELIHVYGPTESTTFATTHRVRRVDPSAATVPIGRAIANTSAHVLDERLAPVPQGVVGELFIGGDGLALGYHRRAELTAARFIANPFGEGRLYRTGDRCRVNAGGDIEFVGRADRQIKLRGFRVEPEEVERVLASHPSVTAAIVDVVGDGVRRRLVACVAGAADLPVDEIRRFAAARLPAYMVPSTIACARDVPVTANGKIDRERLTALLDDEEVARRVRGARDPLEAELIALWEQLLDTAPIGIDDDFFALGGHSLLAAAMIDRVETLFGWRVPIGALLQHPTIEGLATSYWELARAADTPLVILRESGVRPPLFFMHGDLNGGGFYCRRLAHTLDQEQPLYAIAPLNARDETPPASIEEMATRYLDIVQRTRPTGPIALGGYCHGALVAYEMARRLTGTREVTTVVMVHPSPVEPRLAPLDTVIRMSCRLRRSGEPARVAATVRVVQALQFAREAAAADLLAWVRRKAAASRWSAPPGPAVDGAGRADRNLPARGERHDADAWERNIRAVFAFVPRRYSGRVVVFGPREGDGTLVRSWRRAAPRTQSVSVPGNHRTCVTTHVESLGAALDEELRGRV